jgi:hypothetical protein
MNNKTAVVLIDFDNLFKKDLSSYNENDFFVVFKNIVNEIVFDIPNINKINIRLYGGWFKENTLSSKASILVNILAQINLFPYIQINPLRRIYGSIEIATSLYGINYIWHNTLREKNGLPRLKVNTNLLTSICEENKNVCPAKILNKFTKSKNRICSVPGCTTKNKNVFISIEQKMVDTMLSCDLISFCNEIDIKYILLFSDDTDFFPPLALGSHIISESDKKITLAIKNALLLDNYKEILEPFNVEIIPHNYE